MVWISLTRLRLRSARFLPGFAWYALRSNLQMRRAPGFLAADFLNDRIFTFWTQTAWESRDAMRAFMTSGAHMQAMPRLLHWCDEASVAHWEQESAALIPWPEADQRMRSTGRPSKVNHPTPEHASLTYQPPRQ